MAHGIGAMECVGCQHERGGDGLLDGFVDGEQRGHGAVVVQSCRPVQ